MINWRSVVFVLFFSILLLVGSVSAVPARVHNFDPNQIKSVEATPIPEPGLVHIFRFYDFFSERDIDAYQCRMGAYPAEFPDEINSQVCYRRFLDITDDDRLDWPDEEVVGGSSWHNYATHHFFVLRNINEDRLRKFSVGYVSYNKYSNKQENHHIYVRNFDTGEWELLDEAFVDKGEQGLMGYCSGFGSKTEYVENGEMWFMGTEGPYGGNTIATDSFAAILVFSLWPGVQVQREVALPPSWMNEVCSA